MAEPRPIERERGVATIFIVTIFSTVMIVCGVTFDLVRVTGQRRASAQQASSIARHIGQLVSDAALSEGRIEFPDENDPFLYATADEVNEAAGYPTGGDFTKIFIVDDELVVEVGKPVRLYFLRLISAGAMKDKVVNGSASIRMTIGQ